MEASVRAARRTLEAIRLGVVPSEDVAAYTVGRERDMALVESDLDGARDDGGGVRAFLGDYGAGKTHLLELIQQRALARGFVVARAVLDTRETSPSHPRRVYRALIRTMRTPNRPLEEGTGLRQLIERAVATPPALTDFATDRPRRDIKTWLAADAHLYLSPALRFARALTAPAEGVDPGERAVGLSLLYEWLEGCPTLSNQAIDARLSARVGRQGKLYSLRDYRPWARIYAYLISGLARLARSVGFAGLVVLIDEAEFTTLLSDKDRAHALRLFQALTLASVGEGEGVLPFEAEELELGGYGVLKSLPVRYSDAPGLYTVLAMTPHSEGMAALRQAVPARQISELTMLGKADYVRLSAQVCGVYGRAWPDCGLPPGIDRALGGVVAGLIGTGQVASARQAIKFIAEFLDVVRAHPSKVGQVVRDLQTTMAF